MGKDPLGRIRYDHWEETFRVNTLGPVRVTEALLPHLARGARPLVVAITSRMGSIADIEAPRDYAYRSSEAGLNAAMHGLAHELEARGIGVLLLHPGWVRTRMGGAAAGADQRQPGWERVLQGQPRGDTRTHVFKLEGEHGKAAGVHGLFGRRHLKPQYRPGGDRHIDRIRIQPGHLAAGQLRAVRQHGAVCQRPHLDLHNH